LRVSSWTALNNMEEFSGITDERLNDIRIIGVASLVAILILAITGLNWITRVQIGLLALLVVSQVDFVVGTFIPPSDEAQG
jgi:solute carrier family 12 (sodium/potassium/chloride transporter), member 2